MWILFMAHVSFAACEEEATTQTLLDAIGDAEAAFGAIDIPTFLESSDQIRGEIIPCLAEPVPRSMAADIHRLEGLRAFGERDMFAIRAFAAARSIEPAYRFPSTFVPNASPIYDDYTAMDVEAGRFEDVAPPADGEFRFDGTVGTQRPLSWPTLFQHMDGDGAVVSTAYLRGKDPLPEYEIRVEPEPEDPKVSTVSPPIPAPPTVVTKTFGDAHPALVAAAGVTAASAIGLYAAAGVSHQTWADPATPDGQTQVLRQRVNRLTVASGITGLASIGLGTAVVVTW